MSSGRGSSSLRRGVEPTRVFAAALSLVVATCLCCAGILLASASASAAPLGVYDYFSSVGTPQAFPVSPGALAVNDTSGDVYIAGGDVPQIFRLSSTGQFVSTWGRDVIVPGAPGDQGTGFEVCTVAANCKAATTGTLGGELNAPRGIAVDAAGLVYVGDALNRRIQVFTAAGAFVRAFGRDIVQTGQPGDSPAQAARQSLTVDAAGGTFTLAFQGQTTTPIAADATAVAVQNALQALSSVGLGNATVTGGPGGAGGGTPYVITFAGALTNSPQPLIAANADSLTGGAATASVVSTQAGSYNVEVCTVASTCQAPANAATAGAFNSVGVGALASVAIAPVGAPNAGNVLVAEGNANARVQEFTADGQFVRTFGWDVTVAGPGNSGTQFESCVAARFDVCQAGAQGAGLGQFGNPGTRSVAQDADGNVYVADIAANFRVQKFVPSGADLAPQAFDPQIGLEPGLSLTGTSVAGGPSHIAVGPSGDVFVVRGFLAGQGDPVAWIPEARVLQFSTSGALKEVHAANAGLAGGEGTSSGLDVTADGRIYLLPTPALAGPFFHPKGVFILDDVPAATIDDVEVSNVGASTATIQARIVPSAASTDTLYRIEYAPVGTDAWLAAPQVDANIGDGTGSGDPGNCPAGDPPSCDVVQQLFALDLDVEYKTRVVARTEYNGSVSVFDGPSFTPHAVAPIVTTQPAVWSSPAATGPSLLFSATVNTGRARTTYAFQYVDHETFTATGFDRAQQVPSEPAEAGEGSQTLAMTQNLPDLDPTKTYDYRIVATNGHGTSYGATRTVAPPSELDRFYERVSTGDSWGSGVFPEVESVSGDGSRASFQALTFGNPSSLPGIFNRFVSERSPTGWEVKPMMPDPGHASDGPIGGFPLLSSDMGSMLWAESSYSERQRGEVKWAKVDIDGTRSEASKQITPLSRQGYVESYKPQGASLDLSTFVFNTFWGQPSVTLLPDETLLNGASNLYMVRSGPGGPELSVVNRADGADGSVIGGRCGAGLGGEFRNQGGTKSHAISDDGSVVYFTVAPSEPMAGSCPLTPGPQRLYKRIDGTTTVEVTASQCTRTAGDAGGTCQQTDAAGDRFRGASADGSVVAFISRRQLVGDSVDPGDTDADDDLYIYDASPPAGQPNLVMASAGEVTPSHPVVGAGASVRGVLDIAANGSRTYFVADGALTGANAAGSLPEPGKPNLYVFERDAAHPAGRLAFVGILDADNTRKDSHGLDIGDPGSLWSQTGGTPGKAVHALPNEGEMADGRFLVFATFAKLVALDSDDHIDVYRYDDGAEELQCLSCAGNGPFDVRLASRNETRTYPDAIQSVRVATTDVSTVVFATPEPLVAQDTNQPDDPYCNSNEPDRVRGCDIYAWRDGELDLISRGTGEFGIAAPAARPASITPDGKSVFFTTEAPLVAADGNNVGDMYVARIGGGFLDSRRTSSACPVLDDGCQAASVPGRATEPRTDPGTGSANAVPGARAKLRVEPLGARALRHAARTAALTLTVRTTAPGTVRAVARARISKRLRRVAGDVKRVAKPGRVTLRLRLSRAARKRLRSEERLRIGVVVSQAGLRNRSLSVLLKGSK